MQKELTLNEKILAIKNLENDIRNHPMTLRFYQDSRYYIVIFPSGSHPELDGVRAEKSNNKSQSLARLLAKLEKCWKETML